MSGVPFRVKALFEYSSPHEDDLQFGIGQIITVTEEEDAEWYNGEYVDDDGAMHQGIFPQNFVEKYEPAAPPRPVRRAKKEPQAAVDEETSSAAPLSPKTEQTHHDAAAEPEPKVKPQSPKVAAAPFEASAPPPAEPIPSLPEPVPEAGSSESKPGPPPVAAKSSSIRDRIAAFNKPGGTPITPFKPSGPGGGFVKKFVPPPPARNSFVPPPRAEPPPKKYIREEDPETKEIEAENRDIAERAGFGSSATQEELDEEHPKPTSLQERIALLQRQQAEAAQRHADMAAKKEKPKRPPKKRTESSETPETAAETEALRPPPPERRDTEDTEGKTSLDEPRMPPPPRRKSSKGPAAHIIDGNEADMSGGGDTTEGPEELTERDDSDERSRHPPRSVPPPPRPADDGVEEEVEAEEEGEEEEEEDEVDPEIRRKEELRARMAKMSGGMGMPGMFMPFPGPAAPKKKKPTAPKEPTYDQEEEEPAAASRAAPPVPTMMALPGMSHARRSEDAQQPEADEPEPTPRAPPPAVPTRQPIGDDDDENRQQTPPSEPPKLPSGRPAPPPIPGESRPSPPPRPADAPPASPGSLSDDELSEHPTLSPDGSRNQLPATMRSPPPLPPSIPSPRSPSASQIPTFPPPAAPAPVPSDYGMPSSPSAATPVPGNRASRAPPPVPGAAPPLPSQTRPPPPPPPGVLSRESTADEFGALPSRPPPPRPLEESEEEEVTEYEGDYDTDIASSVPHKDALKASGRESSFEDMTPMRSPTSPMAEAPPSAPPPIPGAAARRAVPPPIPSQPPPPPMADTRQSVDAPRAAPPPPPPPAKEAEEYDPYPYVTPQPSSGYHPATSKIEEGSYFGESSRAAPSAPPPSGRPPPKQSLDVQRGPGRMSADVGRPSMDSGFIAGDVDLAIQSGWWKQANQVPPILQGRKDVYYESEESTTTNRGAKTVVTRTIYVLYMDYSQTVLTVRFDPYDASDVDIDQRHEAPPRHLRQDQLEQSYDRFGRAMYDVVTSKKDTVVGDGTPYGLIFDLLRPFRDALRPVGTRAYGALVYANMANASTQQNDEIRPGDIISIRNARFQGKHGPMHAKYSMDVGKPDHVGVVSEWDGTKKKVRAWEQGRESKKVKLESFKLDDLRSGEVKIWRIMPRSWVGWNTKP